MNLIFFRFRRSATPEFSRAVSTHGSESRLKISSRQRRLKLFFSIVADATTIRHATQPGVETPRLNSGVALRRRMKFIIPHPRRNFPTILRASL